jgi:hypothetical protein
MWCLDESVFCVIFIHCVNIRSSVHNLLTDWRRIVPSIGVLSKRCKAPSTISNFIFGTIMAIISLQFIKFFVFCVLVIILTLVKWFDAYNCIMYKYETIEEGECIIRMTLLSF